MTTFQPHISQVKEKEVQELKSLLATYPVMGVVNLETLPALILQRMKKNLREKVVFKITKKRLMKIAFDEAQKKNLDQVKEKLEGIPALLFTKEDPFKLYKEIKKSRASAPAKPGQKAPNDLTISAGPTPFTPGPMIGELGQLGIKTEVKEGKIHVREEKVLVKEGEVISRKAAELLAKLGVEPMMVGLNLLFTYHEGEILSKDVLDVDEELFLQQIKEAHAAAMALALHLGIINQETIKPLVQKAYRESKALAEKANITTAETIGKKLGEAERGAAALQQKMPEAPEEVSVTEETSLPEKQEEVTQQQESNTQEVKQPAAEDTEAGMQAAQIQDIQKSPASQVVEDKHQVQESEMERAEKFLKELTEKAIKVEGSKRVEPKAQQQDFDVNRFINQMKDKKSKGEL